MESSSARVADRNKASSAGKLKRRRWPFERRVKIFCAALPLPALILSTVLLWQLNVTAGTFAILLGIVAFVSLLIGVALHEHITRPLQTLSNVVSALREEDFSFRARNAVAEDALGELSLEINWLADMLQAQRLSALEATALLRRVVEAMDAPILAFDRDNVLRLINPATEHAFGLNAEHAIGRGADELRLAGILGDRAEEIVTLPWQGTETRWMVRRTSFRQRGVPHTLLLLSDVSSALREEEYRAWQKLIRVLGHELNNSLAPIKSIAGSLRSRVDRNGFPGDDLPDFERGLSVIESRAEALNRFVQGYREFAKLPPPRKRETSIRSLLERVVKLETRLEVGLTTGPDLILLADPDQLEHMLINLVRNAVEATRERMNEENYRPDVQITWTSEQHWARVSVLDNGPGLVNPSNLFVPFYTTKAHGSGVGLILARQIAEAHDGSVQLSNRRDQQGCEAQVRLPLRR